MFSFDLRLLLWVHSKALEAVAELGRVLWRVLRSFAIFVDDRRLLLLNHHLRNALLDGGNILTLSAVLGAVSLASFAAGVLALFCLLVVVTLSLLRSAASPTTAASAATAATTLLVSRVLSLLLVFTLNGAFLLTLLLSAVPAIFMLFTDRLLASCKLVAVEALNVLGLFISVTARVSASSAFSTTSAATTSLFLSVALLVLLWFPDLL